MLSNITGKVIISGMGKSGHIGKKIATTLASTGTPSYFIHPAEASHGDLGMIGANDAIILISSSGDTAELKDITLFAKFNKIKTVCIVTKKDSFLGENTDISLVTGKLEEAMPNLPAPTTSTTVMMMIGDIIAGCLSVYKNFDKTKYNKFHPGGFLGKSLSHIGDVIKKQDLPVVKIDTKMHDIILEITSKKYGLVVVTDDNNCVLGTISDGDLRRHMEDDILSLTAKDVMSVNAKTVHCEIFVTDVIEILTQHKILTILVLDNKEKFIGIAQLYDLIK
jgi:arabinose-5-phosphate isomerase